VTAGYPPSRASARAASTTPARRAACSFESRRESVRVSGAAATGAAWHSVRPVSRRLSQILAATGSEAIPLALRDDLRVPVHAARIRRRTASWPVAA
jgi:hypothetical protein